MEVENESTTGPNWLDLPKDLTANILQRLGALEILMSASQVCPLWWNICKDPLMWRTIHIHDYHHSPFGFQILVKICCNAVEPSCGLLEEIDIEHICTDELLKCISDNGRHIRCMRLVHCFAVTDEGFSEAVRKLPQLEKVDVSLTDLTEVSLEALGQSCPLLKSLKLKRRLLFDYFESDEMAFVIADTMPGLCHLDMNGHELTELGVLSILHKCPLLESLNIRGSHFLSEHLKKRCIDQINNLQLPDPLNYQHNYYNDHVCHWLL